MKIRRCLRLPANERGRDLVVGDLHGHRGLFEQALDHLRFDPGRDRVLSVGDLIDRGPDSLDTLSLIEQPWFHAVLGNHELMLLNYLGHYGSRVHSRKAWAGGAGKWIVEALAARPRLVARLAQRVAELPLALHVEGEMPFNVMHGDLHPVGARQQALLAGPTISVHEADAATASRANFGLAMRSVQRHLSFGAHPVRLSATPLGELPITYVGHSPVRNIVVHGSYVYIDQGIGNATAGPGSATLPTVLDHRRFAHWLDGATLAPGDRPRASATILPNAVTALRAERAAA